MKTSPDQSTPRATLCPWHVLGGQCPSAGQQAVLGGCGEPLAGPLWIPGLTYSFSLQYMGCVEVLQSMRALDFNTRTQVTR